MSKNKKTIFDKRQESLTKIELEKKTRQEIADMKDWAEAVDSSDENTSQHALEEERKETLQEEKDTKDLALNYADEKKRWWLTYSVRLAEYGQFLLSKIDFPANWDSLCLATDGSAVSIFGRTFNTKQGIVVAVKDPSGNVYVRAIQTSMDVLFDTNAIEVLVNQAENTLDFATGKLESVKSIDPLTGMKKTKSGLLI